MVHTFIRWQTLGYKRRRSMSKPSAQLSKRSLDRPMPARGATFLDWNGRPFFRRSASMASEVDNGQGGYSLDSGSHHGLWSLPPVASLWNA